MNKEEVLTGLESFKHRLLNEVLQAYQTRGSTYGRERFSAWRSKLTKFLDSCLPNESSRLNSKLQHMVFTINGNESDAEQFWREDGDICISFIDSLMIDVRNDEYDFEEQSPIMEVEDMNLSVSTTKPTKVFIVHGHDDLTKIKVARFVEKLGYEAIILHEQASRGKTIIEKIETYTDVGFAIILYTPDDVGNNQEEASAGSLNARARQNVIFEHGYLIAKLGRDKVVPLVTAKMELPSDIMGVVYVSDTDWQINIAKEMKHAGYNIDFNKLM